MRTTLDLEDNLVKLAKREALQKGQTLTAFIEEALRNILYSQKKRQKPYRLKWQPIKGELMPGVDISNRNTLLEIMEDRK